jgi:integrase
MSAKKTRGRYGQGSIAEQPNGKWKATFSAGMKDDNSRRRESRVFVTKREANNWLNHRQQQRNLGMQNTRERQTLEQFADWWLTHEAPLSVRADTANTYRYLFTKYAKPQLGKKYLDSLNTDHIVELLRNMQQRGLSTNTIKRVRSNLHLICQNALRHRYIGHNPVALVRTPKPRQNEKSQVQPPLTLSEAHALLDSVVGTALEGIVHVGLHMGLRRGEVLGLQWSDIDFDRRTLTVNQTLKEGSTILPDGTSLTHARTNPPKTRNSHRTLELPDVIVGVFEKQKRTEARNRLKAGEAWQATGFVFTNELGGSLWPNGVGKRFKKHLSKNNLRHIRFHDLRHSAATLMLEHGVRIEEVSQALGHASITITKDVYAPHVPSLGHRAIHGLADALGGNQNMSIAVGQNQHQPVMSRGPEWRNDT